MRNLTVTLCLTIVLLLRSAEGSWGTSFQKGFPAYKSGDYATAPRESKPLAEHGDADAQGNLGELCICSLTLPEIK